MRSFNKSTSTVAVLSFLLAAGAAQGSDGILVKVTNDTSANVVVTVIDMNANPEQALVAVQRICPYPLSSGVTRIESEANP